LGKGLRSFTPCYSQSPLLSIPPPPFSKSGLKLVCYVNIVYGNLKSENSQDYTQKPQRNCTFMNSTSGVTTTESKNKRVNGRGKLKTKGAPSRGYTVQITQGVSKFFLNPLPMSRARGQRLYGISCELAGCIHRPIVDSESTIAG
jgi:hypothetical protein